MHSEYTQHLLKTQNFIGLALSEGLNLQLQGLGLSRNARGDSTMTTSAPTMAPTTMVAAQLATVAKLDPVEIDTFWLL